MLQTKRAYKNFRTVNTQLIAIIIKNEEQTTEFD